MPRGSHNNIWNRKTGQTQWQCLPKYHFYDSIHIYSTGKHHPPIYGQISVLTIATPGRHTMFWPVISGKKLPRFWPAYGPRPYRLHSSCASVKHTWAQKGQDTEKINCPALPRQSHDLSQKVLKWETIAWDGLGLLRYSVKNGSGLVFRRLPPFHKVV